MEVAVDTDQAADVDVDCGRGHGRGCVHVGMPVVYDYQFVMLIRNLHAYYKPPRLSEASMLVEASTLQKPPQAISYLFKTTLIEASTLIRSLHA